MVSNLSPLIALIGAVYLFYRRQATERKELRREEKRKAYVSFVHQYGLLWNEITSGPSSSDISRVTALSKRHYDEIRLLASDEVVEAARLVRSEYINFGSFTLSFSTQEWLNMSPEQKAKDLEWINKISTSEHNLVSVMKADLQSSE